jgi:hypothetical protein
MNECCDNGQCPAQARVTVFTRCGPLFMCGHHFRRHSGALEPLVFGAYDMVTGHPRRSKPFSHPGTTRAEVVLHGCRNHAAGTTWERYPCSMKGRQPGIRSHGSALETLRHHGHRRALSTPIQDQK